MFLYRNKIIELNNINLTDKLWRFLPYIVQLKKKKNKENHKSAITML